MLGTDLKKLLADIIQLLNVMYNGVSAEDSDCYLIQSFCHQPLHWNGSCTSVNDVQKTVICKDICITLCLIQEPASLLIIFMFYILLPCNNK